MKRFIYFAMFLCLLAVMVVPIGAEEAVEVTSETNLFGRLYEFFIDNSNDILTVALGGAVIILSLIFDKRNSAKSNLISTGIEVLKNGNNTTLDSQASVVNVANELIDAMTRLDASYREFIESYEKIRESEGERTKAVSDVVDLEKAIIEILATVYPNSANLPQGIKDIVTLTYAKCMKKVEGSSDDKV